MQRKLLRALVKLAMLFAVAVFGRWLFTLAQWAGPAFCIGFLCAWAMCGVWHRLEYGFWPMEPPDDWPYRRGGGED